MLIRQNAIQSKTIPDKFAEPILQSCAMFSLLPLIPDHSLLHNIQNPISGPNPYGSFLKKDSKILEAIKTSDQLYIDNSNKLLLPQKDIFGNNLISLFPKVIPPIKKPYHFISRFNFNLLSVHSIFMFLFLFGLPQWEALKLVITLLF